MMIYKRVMKSSNAKLQGQEVGNEHNRMTMNNTKRVIKRNTVPKEASILNSTWAIKKKSNGKLQERVTSEKDRAL